MHCIGLLILGVSIFSVSGLQVTITAALGFDSFLVMRHGAGPSDSCHDSTSQTNMANLSLNATNTRQRLGCYFCNDVVAPIDVIFSSSCDMFWLILFFGGTYSHVTCSSCSQLPTAHWTSNALLLAQGLLPLHQPLQLNFLLEFYIILKGMSSQTVVIKA